MKTRSCLANGRLRGWTKRLNEFLKLRRTFGAVDVDNDKARAGCDPNIGVRPSTKPSFDLFRVIGRLSKSVLRSRVLGNTFTVEFSAGALQTGRSFDNRMQWKYAPLHPRIRERGVKHFIRHERTVALILRGKSTLQPLAGTGTRGSAVSSPWAPRC